MDQEQSEKLSWGTVTIAVYNQTCQENNVAFPFLFCVLFLLSQDLKKLRRIRKWQLLRRSYYCRYAEGEKSHSGKISWRGTVDSREILNLGSNTWIDWVQTCRQLWHCFLSHFLELMTPLDWASHCQIEPVLPLFQGTRNFAAACQLLEGGRLYHWQLPHDGLSRRTMVWGFLPQEGCDVPSLPLQECRWGCGTSWEWEPLVI